jgi:hypothetical protein
MNKPVAQTLSANRAAENSCLKPSRLSPSVLDRPPAARNDSQAAAPTGQGPHRQRAERAALAKIAERIASQFPESSAEEIDRAIQGRYAAVADSRIRDFVPVLVEP